MLFKRQQVVFIHTFKGILYVITNYFLIIMGKVLFGSVSAIHLSNKFMD